MHKNGYHSHTHNHCKHDLLQYCEHCDVVYCVNCGREWGQKTTVTYEYKYEPYIWTNRGIPYTVSYSNGNYSLTTSNGTVVKDAGTIAAFYASVSNEKSGNTVHTHSTK